MPVHPLYTARVGLSPGKIRKTLNTLGAMALDSELRALQRAAEHDREAAEQLAVERPRMGRGRDRGHRTQRDVPAV